MQVFKNYFKILKKHKATIFIYTIIFAVMAYATGTMGYSSTKENTSFTQSKTDAVLINNDGDSEITESFKTYLENYCEFQDMDYDVDELKDNLFYGTIKLVIIIPEGFSDKVAAGQDAQIEKMEGYSSSSANYVKIAINNYLSTAKYVFSLNIDQSTTAKLDMISDSVTSDLSVETTSSQDDDNVYEFFGYYINFFVYIFSAVFTTIIGMVMISYQKKDIRRRNLIAPLSLKKMQGQLFAATLVFTYAFEIVMLVLGLFITKVPLDDTHTLLFIANTLVFTLCMTGLAFMISQFTLTAEAISVITQIISLGMSFISGAFVPQELLSGSVLNVAKFTPAYWYVAINNKIASVETVKTAVIKDCVLHNAVILIFTAAFFAVALVIANKKKREA